MPYTNIGSRTCECTGCGQFFNSVSIFDKHLVYGTGMVPRCLTVKQMKAKGWSLNKAGCWIGSPMPEGIHNHGK